jgi:hypothetical protein
MDGEISHCSGRRREIAETLMRAGCWSPSSQATRALRTDLPLLSFSYSKERIVPLNPEYIHPSDVSDTKTTLCPLVKGS